MLIIDQKIIEVFFLFTDFFISCFSGGSLCWFWC